MDKIKTVIIESPYAGDKELNVKYGKRCMLDSLKRGEAPFLSHLLYTQCLNDDIREERHMGMNAGFAWVDKSDYTVVYTDYGISKGMEEGIARAKNLGHNVEYRSIGNNT